MCKLRLVSGRFGEGPTGFPIVAAATIALGLARAPVAEAVEHHFGAWNGIFTQGKFSEPWGWFFERQI